ELAVLFSLAGLLGMALLAHNAGARRFAPVAVLCGIIDPYYLYQSRFVQTDMPAVVCIVWAIIFLCYFWRRESRICLAISGGLSAAALLIKPLTLAFAALIVMSIFLHRARRTDGRLRIDFRNLAIDTVTFFSAALLVALPFVNVGDIVGEFHRTVGAHWIERPQDAPGFIERLSGLIDFLRVAFVWLPLAFIGALAGLRSHRRLTWLLLLGEFFSAIVLLQFPPWEDHYVLLSPILIILAVIGMEQAYARFQEGFKKRLSIFAAVAFVLGLPWLVHNDIHVLRTRPNDLTKVTTYLRQNIPPDAFIISDYAIVAYLAGRLLPPSAMNLCFPRTFRSYEMAHDDLARVIGRYPVAAVVLMSDHEQDPRLIDWIREQFPRANVVEGDSLKTTAQIFARQTP